MGLDTITNKIKNLFNSSNNNDDFFTLRKLRSNLPVNLFIDTNHKWYNKSEDYYVIKVQNNLNDIAEYKHSFSITISEEPKVIESKIEIALSDTEQRLVKKFIKQNIEKLIKVANKEIDIFEFLDSFKAL